MARRPNRSPQTIALLQALLERPRDWRHGYDLATDLSLLSGTLYPMLRRLHEDGWLDAKWEETPEPGRPPRHLYRLSGEGAARAREHVAVTKPAGRARLRAREA